jgi:bacillithiol system protein YtxJ
MIRSSTPEIDGVWKRFTSEPDWQQLLKDSHERPVILYKHSSRCGVSHASWDEVERIGIEFGEETDLYFIDVIRERAQSLSIAQQSGIRHESPQLLLLWRGEVVQNWTHWSIRFPVVEEALIGILDQ